MKGLIDSTLREGQQTVGVLFSQKQKEQIFCHLLEIGIEEIEMGVVSRLDPDLPDLLRKCRGRGPRLALWSRCRSADISLAASLDPDVLSLSIPVSDRHIRQKLGRQRDWVLETTRESITQARDLGIRLVSLGLEDATRAAPNFVEEAAGVAAEAGAGRIRLADTVGIAGPQEIAALVGWCKSASALEIGVHTHNDFGMATANVIAAFDAGADWADVTVLGLGERAGNARLEEVAAYLSLRRGRTYRLEAIPHLCRMVASETNRTIDRHQPVIGPDIFACETGLHLQGLARDPATYEPYPPEVIGARRHLLYGSKVGRRAIREQLSALEIMLSEAGVEEVVRATRQEASKRGRPLAPGELKELILHRKEAGFSRQRPSQAA